MVSICCDLSAPLLMQSIGLSKLEAHLAFMVLQPFQFLAFVRSGLNFRDSGVALPDCQLVRAVRGVQVPIAMLTCS